MHVLTLVALFLLLMLHRLFSICRRHLFIEPYDDLPSPQAKPPSTTAAVVPANPPQQPQPQPPPIQRSGSGTIKRTASTGQVVDAAHLAPTTESNPTTPTPSNTNPRSPPKINTAALPPLQPSHNSGLFCSVECARLEEERSSTVLAPLLSSQLSFGAASTSPLHHSWTPSAEEPPSPFFLSANGSDSESGEYFLDGTASGSARGGESERERATRRGSRSTNCTTGSSSDSLASLWDGVDSGTGHPFHGLRRMTPLNGKPDMALLGGPGGLLAAGGGEPIPIRPISAQSLIPPPPITSPSPASYSRRASSSSYSRSSSHSHAHSASAHLNPSAYSMSPPPFEPGSAPSTASLYASYAQSFQRTPSVESRLAMYGGPKMTGASPRRGRPIFGGGEDDNSARRTSTTGLSASYTSSKRSTSVSSSNSSASYGGSKPEQKTTPTQPHHLHRPSLPATSLPSSRRPSTVVSTSPLEHSHSSQSLLTRPPPSKTRLAYAAETKAPASVGAGGASSSWNWSAMEKMYEVPRLAKTKGEGGGQEAVGGVGSGAKLFYWGAD